MIDCKQLHVLLLLLQGFPHFHRAQPPERVDAVWDGVELGGWILH